ncbi:exodeoxyribonuclease VII large subunit [Venatoribacter cucullus]|uniref:exodeoxyribonuclease VII large subunit n=1 Tax=Venatoribacter cucullus TaxID=2661630 RepID=UPI00224099FC|nr:exodeoxyribonuclease VII large subunit [Venatoribacter cucullus]UZK03847.1 exodeoxyribonuclease VII large subunit [Venatoribacter cucullus]
MSTLPAVFTVSQLNQRARQLLEISFASVRVEGEISNLSRPSSGHWYFTLKDSAAQVRCAMFRSRTALLRFQPKEGDKIELRGKVSLYENRGDYQLIVDSMQPAGEGALLLAFQQLKERLALEGLFDTAYKKTLPPVRRIGVITSPTGAAIHDILTVLARRDPSLEVDIYPTAVQGKEATAQIVAAIERANRDQRVDALIVGRGGGSLEDLWCFNEEAVARAIFQSQLPVISAVGHEVDVTIADFVADARAPTPSAAAELVSTDRNERLQQLQQLQQRLNHSLQRLLPRWQQQLHYWQQRLRAPGQLLQQRTQQLDQLELRLQRALHQRLQQQQSRVKAVQQALKQQHPQRQLQQQQLRLQQLQQQLLRAQRQQLRHAQQQLQPLPARLQHSMGQQQQQWQQQLAAQAKLLHSLSPLNVLARGYSITQFSDGRVVNNAADVQPGDRIRTRLQHGWLDAEVTRSQASPEE